MSTIEAIQVKLEGFDGYILWPGDPDSPPTYISDEELALEANSLRIFPEYNPAGVLFIYVHDDRMFRWHFKERIFPGL